MSENSSVSSDIMSSPVVIAGMVIALLLFVFFQKQGGFDFYYQNTILPFLYQLKIWTIRVVITLVSGTITFFIGKKIFNKWQYNKRKKRELEEQKIKEEKERVEEERKRKEQLAEERARAEREKIWESKIKDVFDYFLKNDSSHSISFEHKDYHGKIIEEARNRYRHYCWDRTQQQRDLEDAQEDRRKGYLFVHKNQGLPSDFDTYIWKKKKFYLEAFDLLKQGKLSQVIREEFRIIQPPDYENIGGEQREKELLEHNFYLQEELSKEETEFLKKFHQYQLVKASNFGDGFIDVVIRPEREGNTHLILKNQFARLGNAVMEHYPDKRSDLRVDVAFLDQKIAVEVERGTNKDKDIREKIEKLNKYFDKTIIVCSRENMKRYKKFKQEDKIFVLTPKDAKEKVMEWLKST